MQGHEFVMVVVALAFGVSCSKVDGRRTSITVGVLSHARPLAVCVYDQGFRRVINILSTVVAKRKFTVRKGAW